MSYLIIILKLHLLPRISMKLFLSICPYHPSLPADLLDYTCVRTEMFR